MSFKTILIPVDFTINTELALQKAAGLVNTQDAQIHLLHVGRQVKAYNRIFSFSYFDKPPIKLEDAKLKLEELVSRLSLDYPQMKVHAAIRAGGNVEQAIFEKAKEINSDLVIIGKSSEHWLPLSNTVHSGRLAKNTGIPVLTVKPGAINQEIKTVVIPVEKQFSQSKISGLVSLIKKTRIQICLLAFAGKKDKTDQLPAPLLNSYRLFKKNTFDEVSFNIIRDANKGRAVLDFCKSVNADLLIVNPDSETGIGWFNEHISDALPAASKTQILAV